VIAFGKGGAAETIRGLDSRQPTGVFFSEQTVEDIVRAVRHFESESRRIAPQDCRDNAMRFSVERYRNEFRQFVESAWADWRKDRTLPGGD
jgi:glycogen synthase